MSRDGYVFVIVVLTVALFKAYDLGYTHASERQTPQCAQQPKRLTT
jgi:hypothetical protein